VLILTEVRCSRESPPHTGVAKSFSRGGGNNGEISFYQAPKLREKHSFTKTFIAKYQKQGEPFPPTPQTSDIDKTCKFVDRDAWRQDLHTWTTKGLFPERAKSGDVCFCHSKLRKQPCFAEKNAGGAWSPLPPDAHACTEVTRQAAYLD